MPDVSLILHLHHPYLPGAFPYSDWKHGSEALDLAATQASFLDWNERWLAPLAKALTAVFDQEEGVGLGLCVSGSLVQQWERWSVDHLDAWQHLWQHPGVEILPQTWDSTPKMLWDRDAWLQGIKRYQQHLSLLSARFSPIGWNPGYLFIPYLAWPLQHMGIQGFLVDGDSIGWGGSMSHQVARVGFQHRFAVLIRDSGWSHQLQSTEALSTGLGPISLARRWVADLKACQESPVVLTLDLSQWIQHPGLAPAMIAFLEELLLRGAEAGIRWCSPGQVVKDHAPQVDFPAADWVIAPEDRGIMGDEHTHPLSSEILTHWRRINENTQGGLPADLIDSAWLRRLDQTDFQVNASGLRAGHLYGRLIRQMSAKEIESSPR